MTASLDGTIIVERIDKNKRLYGRKLRASEILCESFPAPSEAAEIYEILNLRDNPLLPTVLSTTSAAHVPVTVEQVTPKHPPMNPFRLPPKLSGLATESRSTSSLKYPSPSPTSSPNAGIPFSYTGSIATPLPVRPVTRASGIFIASARALYDFKPQQLGDLTFQRGDTIEIVSKTDSQNDWWKGVCNGRAGHFPANYVEII